jgi:methionine aminotransferase
VHFTSKLPDVGTTIFTVMSRRALDEGAVNIGQGFPDYPIDPRLAAALSEVIGEGRNQYAPMEGVVELREGISAKLYTCYGHRFDPLSEITVTCGGTEALYDAIQAVVGSGDDAVIFDPAYDAYEPAVRLAGGRCIRIVSLRLGPGAQGAERSHALDHHQQPAEPELYDCGQR